MPAHTRMRRWALGGLLALTGAVLSGCGAFNPAFVDLIDQSGEGRFATLDNAPGHVVVQFVNNAEVDESLVAYLESADGGGLVLTNAEKRALRPRVRMRIRVTFVNGIQTIFEFVDGSTRLVDPRFDTQAVPDLNQNDLDNSVVLCDVARVEVDPTSSIEVFVPVSLRVYELVQTTGVGGNITTEFQLRDTLPPAFRALAQDQVDERGNVVLQANVGIRDFPAPVPGPLLCGSVVAIVMNGTLRVPFLRGVDNNPSYDRDAAAVVAGIGGRFEFEVAVVAGQ